MAKKKSWTPKEESEISRIRQTTGATRKTAIRKMRAAAKAKPKVKAQKATKTTTPAQSLPKGVAGMNRSVLRIARKDIVLNQQNKRWECEANTARGDNALRKLSLILTQTSELLAWTRYLNKNGIESCRKRSPPSWTRVRIQRSLKSE